MRRWKVVVAGVAACGLAAASGPRLGANATMAGSASATRPAPAQATLEPQRLLTAGPGAAFPHLQPASSVLPVASTTSSENHARAAWDPKRDRYLVVYDKEELAGMPTPRDIKASFVGVDGRPQGAELAIAADAFDDYEPSVAYNEASDAYLITWTRLVSGSNTDPSAARINAATGAVVGGSILLSGLSDHVENVVVAANPSAGKPSWVPRWLVAWETDRDASGDIARQIYGVGVTADGQLSGQTFKASTGDVNELDASAPALTFAPSANAYLIVYESLLGGDWDIAYTTVNGDNSVVTPLNFNLSTCGDCDDANAPAIAWNAATNTALVTWMDVRATSPQHSVHGRVVTPSQAAGDNDFLIDQALPGFEDNNPSVAADYTGGWTVVFSRPSSTVSTDNDKDIAGHYVGPDQTVTPLFVATIDAGSTPMGDDTRPTLLFNRFLGQYCVLFNHNHSSTDSDVYAVLLGAAKYPLVMAKGDFDHDHIPDRAVIRVNADRTMTWFVIRSSGGAFATTWGAVGDVPVPGDYDGDGKADVAVWRPSDGGWYFVGSAGVSWAYAFGDGASGDVPVPADYDGDGLTDMAVYRPGPVGAFYIISSQTRAGYAVSWGTWGDVPVTADYDGDGKTDIAVWRPANGTFYVVPSSGAPGYSRTFGAAGDQPMVGDFDGDGKTDVALYRPYDTAAVASWYVITSSNGAGTGTSWGTLGDIPLPADYDGDGKTDIGVWRPGTPASAFFIIQSSTGQAVGVPWGTAFDIPVAR